MKSRAYFLYANPGRECCGSIELRTKCIELFTQSLCLELRASFSHVFYRVKRLSTYFGQRHSHTTADMICSDCFLYVPNVCANIPAIMCNVYSKISTATQQYNSKSPAAISRTGLESGLTNLYLGASTVHKSIEPISQLMNLTHQSRERTRTLFSSHARQPED